MTPNYHPLKKRFSVPYEYKNLVHVYCTHAYNANRKLRQAVGSEALFVRQYGPRFRFILEAVSELVYAQRGVSESEVAVALHKWVQSCSHFVSEILEVSYTRSYILSVVLSRTSYCIYIL